ncbi:Retrovirus-related Pol polyprotein from transposon opus [Includes: Protease [Durusdinium trenchii]|uniref:Retrovirus-related Pol polyprotein from transposon opus n=1 Tax=Durusdinium trenchii TaxID=1381693 RepID=A0ABP0JLU8_9DINO
MKEVICMVDLMKDGALAASSARKLNKGGYSLKEAGVRVHLVKTEPVEYLPLVEEVLALLSVESLPSWPSVWQSAEGRIVWSWLEAHPPSRIDFWELFAGQAGLTLAARQRRLSVAPPLDRLYPAFGKAWDLSSPVDQELFWCLYMVLQPAALHAGLPCEHYSVMGQRKPDSNDRSVRELVMRVLAEQEKGGRKGTVESPTGSQLWSEDDWVRSFGQLASPKPPWQYASTDGCQYGMESKGLTDGSFGQPVKKGQIWLSNFCLSEFSLRCGRPDALGQTEHSHRRIKGSVKIEVSGGTKWMGCGILSGVYEPACCHAYMSCLKRTLRRFRARSICQRVPPLEAVSSRNAVYTAVSERQGVVTSDELSAAEREQLDKEVAALSKQMDELWKTRAGQKDWGTVKADLSVYQYSGQKVTEDPRRTVVYRQEVIKELGFGDDWKEKKPYLSAADVEACREVISRKAGGFWLEGSPRTTVRNVLHDCVPSGPPVNSQPHNLKGEAASWVDEKLEEEVRRGQLVRGTSAWGSPPFPTREAPAHKRHRKRRSVVDYRRVNSRVVRSTYYCRKATDVLATAAGGIWFSFVDAVTGFNQIKNTRRAMEVLAIVARSGKFLPVCLTFGPVNGPDDFCYVVDRAYAPGRGRKMKYTREWVAYVDDLTVRTGRVVDGRYLTDDQAEEEVRRACQNAPVQAVQPAGSALEALGVKSSTGPSVSGPPTKHDEVTSDHNHPTRPFFALCFSVFASSSVGSRCSFPHVHVSPQPFLLLRATAVGRGTRAVAADGSPAGRMGRGRGKGQKHWKRNYWEDAGEMGRAMTKAYRHGGYDHRGCLDPEGWIRLDASAELFQVPVAHMQKAIELDGKGAKKRFEVRNDWIRAVQGHSSDSGISDPSQVYYEVTSQSLAERGLGGDSPLWHGTVLERCDGIVRFGMLPGGGDASNRLTVYWVAGGKPSPGEGRTGFRADSTAVVETSVRNLWAHGVKMYHGADGEYGASAVLLSLAAPPESLTRILAIGEESQAYDQVLAEITDSGFELAPAKDAPEARDVLSGVIELPDGDTEATTTDDDEPADPKGAASSSWRGVKEEAPAEAAGSRPLSRSAAELRTVAEPVQPVRAEPLTEPPEGSEVKVGEVAGRKAVEEAKEAEPTAAASLPSVVPSSGEKGPVLDPPKAEEPEATAVASRGIGAAPSAAGESKGKEQTLEPTKDDGEEFVEVEEGEASPDLEAKGCEFEITASETEESGLATSQAETFRPLPLVGGNVTDAADAGSQKEEESRPETQEEGMQVWPRSPPIASRAQSAADGQGKVLNKLQHALNGNGPFVDLAVKVLVGASLIPLAWRTEQEVEEVLDSISSLSSRVLFEIEETTAQTIQITGLICKSAVLGLGIMGLWFLGRTVANRLVRAYHGNTLPAKLLEYKPDGQTSWEVSGSKGTHVVWMRLTTPRQSACACRGFIDAGTCGHIDAAVEQARMMGLGPSWAVQFEEGSVVKNKGAAALKSMGVSGRSTEALCFTGVVSKAQRLFGADESKETTAGCFKGLTHGRVDEDLQHAVREKDAVAAVRAPRPKGGASSAEITVEYLKDRASQEVVIDLLERHPDFAVFLAAYSWDQPDLTKAFAKHKGKIELLADAGQTHRTKLQLQSLLEIRSGGHSVRVARGQSLAKTYKEDGRAVRVGANLKGIQHAKSCLVMTAVHAYLVLGSCNWTTSSKSNRESGLLLTMPKEHQSVRDFLSHFSESWDAGASLEEVYALGKLGYAPPGQLMEALGDYAR